MAVAIRPVEAPGEHAHRTITGVPGNDALRACAAHPKTRSAVHPLPEARAFVRVVPARVEIVTAAADAERFNGHHASPWSGLAPSTPPGPGGP